MPIRGRDQPMTVCTVAVATAFVSLLDAQADEAAVDLKASAFDLA